MKIRNITNDLEPTIGDEINELISKSEQIFLASAFLTEDGFNEIEKALYKALKKNAEVSILIGCMNNFTKPKALEKLLNMKEQWPNLSARFVNGPTGRFHLKTYIFFGYGQMNAIIGSANLTQDGLNDDGEQALLLTVKQDSAIAEEIIAPFKDFWDDENLSNELTREVILTPL